MVKNQTTNYSSLLTLVYLFLSRKKTLIINNALAISGGIFLGLTKTANSVAVLIIGRILVGINAGMFKNDD